MVKGVLIQCKQSEAKNGSQYCTLRIKTDDGEKSVNVWQSTSKQFKLFKVVTITGEKSNEQGISCSLANVKFSDLTKEYSHLVPVPPTREEWLKFILSLVPDMTADQAKFFLAQAEKVYEPYSNMPAAKSNHHVYPGGLLDHTYQLLNMFKCIKNALPFKVNPFIVCISCLFHDYIKLAEYDPETYDYQPIMFLKGHVVGSAEVLGQVMRQANFDSTLILHCQHAILAHHGRQEWGSPVLPATPEAFLVHHLDMLSGHGVMFDETPNNTKSWGLGTTVFHYE